MKLSNKLFTVTTLVVVLAVVITAIFTVNAMYRTYENSIQKDLLMTLQLIDSYEGDLSSLDFGSRRFTKISDDGTVIFDSEADKDEMENHLMRPEVQTALSRMTGFAVRESSTMLENMFYVAKLSHDGTVIRLSEAQSSLYSFIFDSLPYVIAIILAVIIATLFLSNFISKKIVSPINRINLDRPMEDSGLYEELSPLVRRIDEQNSEIKKQIELLRRDRNELELIVKSMKDGLVKLLKGDSLTRGIRVDIDEDNKITIDFHVIVSYGVSILTVADNLIENVKYKVCEFTGLEIKKINIFVEGVRVID